MLPSYLMKWRNRGNSGLVLLFHLLVMKGDDVNKLTKKEICALFIAYFAVKEGVNKKSKGDISFNLRNKYNLTLINSYRSINMIYNP